MPIYEFKCNRCAITKEKLVKFNDKVFCECGYQMNKIMGAPNVRLYGDGFYKENKR